MLSPQVPPPGLVREEAPDSVRDHFELQGQDLWERSELLPPAARLSQPGGLGVVLESDQVQPAVLD